MASRPLLQTYWWSNGDGQEATAVLEAAFSAHSSILHWKIIEASTGHNFVTVEVFTLRHKMREYSDQTSDLETRLKFHNYWTRPTG